MSSRSNDLAPWFEDEPVPDQDTVIPKRLRRHEPPPPPGVNEAEAHGGLAWSGRTTFFNGHDGGGAALVRVMTDSYKTAKAMGTATTVVELPRDGIGPPIDTSVRVLCVRADAMGAKVAMRVVSGESRLVVISAQLDGVFHPKVPHAARYAFRHLSLLCPVRFMPFETRWRSDLKAEPSRRYKRAIARLVTTTEQTRTSAAGIHTPPLTSSRDQ